MAAVPPVVRHAPKPLRKRRSSAEEAAADGFARLCVRVPRGEEVCAERDGSIAVVMRTRRRCARRSW